jgi:hypothetical protein
MSASFYLLMAVVTMAGLVVWDHVKYREYLSVTPSEHVPYSIGDYIFLFMLSLWWPLTWAVLGVGACILYLRTR